MSGEPNFWPDLALSRTSEPLSLGSNEDCEMSKARLFLTVAGLIAVSPAFGEAPSPTLAQMREASRDLTQAYLRLWSKSDRGALAELQDKLMAQQTYGLLLLFQAMDGSAKDGTIKHIMSAAAPQGCTAHNFKEPSENENQRDYLWRFHSCVPPRGKIGVFHRSYYEEVLATRIHPEQLKKQSLP